MLDVPFARRVLEESMDVSIIDDEFGCFDCSRFDVYDCRGIRGAGGSVRNGRDLVVASDSGGD